MINKNIRFYIAIQGRFTPKRYIKLAQYIEELGFDRIYIYDDLMFYSSIPILTLIAEHTKNIEIGPMVLNGFYRHPAIIVSNMLGINEIAEGRTVIGMGRGAFYDFLGMDGSEEYTRNGFEETIRFMKHLLDGKREIFQGKFYNATENAYLKIKSANLPIVAGTWNEDMAYIAGKYCDEIQIAETWNIDYLTRLRNSFVQGQKDANQPTEPRFSIGGVSCVSDTASKCREKMLDTFLVYFPYLTNILRRLDVDYDEDNIARICQLANAANYKEAAKYITPDMVEALTNWGTPERVVNKINITLKSVKVNSIMFSMPYGVDDSVEKNLKMLREKVIPYIKV